MANAAEALRQIQDLHRRIASHQANITKIERDKAERIRQFDQQIRSEQEQIKRHNQQVEQLKRQI